MPALSDTLESLALQLTAQGRMLYIARHALMFSTGCPTGENTVAALSRQALASMDAEWETCLAAINALQSE